MRLALIRLKEDRYRMVWASHHLLFDGWSLPILVGEFLNAYELLISGQKLLYRRPRKTGTKIISAIWSGRDKRVESNIGAITLKGSAREHCSHLSGRQRPAMEKKKGNMRHCY